MTATSADLAAVALLSWATATYQDPPDFAAWRWWIPWSLAHGVR
jgi:hypothetical protein